MSSAHWTKQALFLFSASRTPFPQECNELDWKSNLSEKTDRLVEHLIAFANYPGGGYLVYGVADQNASLIGIKEHEISIIINKLTNLGRDAIDPPLSLDHTILRVEGVPLLFVHIPEQRNKPVHRRGKSIEEAWIRSGGTTRKASRQEIGGLMLHSKQPCWEEQRASLLLTPEEIQKLLDIETIAKLLERSLPINKPQLMHWLTDEKIVIPEGRGYYITNFGAIAAAHDLNQFDTLARKCIRVIRYQGTNKVDTIGELLGKKGYAIGFEGLIGYLRQILPHSEIIQQALRTQTTIYPEIALRELIANALIHQDFNITGAGPLIEIFEDRIEFTNPGSLPSSKRLDRLIGTTPESRNERLASAFRRYRICEERGTGFEKVISAVELYNLPPVTFSNLENSFRVSLYSPRKFSEMSQPERLEACYQHAVLQHLSSKSLTNTTLRQRFKLHEKQRTQITNLILDATKKGRIKRKVPEGGNKFAEYCPYWA